MAENNQYDERIRDALGETHGLTPDMVWRHVGLGPEPILEPDGSAIRFYFESEQGLTRAEVLGLGSALETVAAESVVEPHPGLLEHTSDEDPALLQPTGTGGTMGTPIIEVITIVLPLAFTVATTAGNSLIQRLVDGAIDWLVRSRRRNLPSGAVIEVRVLYGPDGAPLKQIEVLTDAVGAGPYEA